MFNFDIKKTEIFWVARMEKILLFRFAKFFEKLFFYLLIASLASVAFVYLEFLSELLVIKLSVIFFVVWLLFLEISLFLELKIKKHSLEINIADVILNPDNYNLAEFLSLEALKIVEDSIKFCKKRRIPDINSTALLHSGLKVSKEIKLIIYRLGLDAGKLQEDSKNYLEKIQKNNDGNTNDFSAQGADVQDRSASGVRPAKSWKITHLAQGLPVGGELEYADEETLESAFEGRK